MSDLRTEGFHHVAKVTADIAASLRFYRDALGLRLVKRTAVLEDDAPAWKLWLGLEHGQPGSLISVRERRDGVRGRAGVGGIHHTALGVADEDALLMWKRWLTDLGLRVAGPFDRKWFTSIYLADPDGQVVEMATRGPGYAVDEPADALGEREIDPGEDRMRGSRDESAIAARTHPEPVDAITPEMALTGIHHVSGITDDVEVAHRFYTRGLGLRRVKRTVNQDAPSIPHHFWARYEGETVMEGSSMTLFGWPPRGARVRHGAGQTHHIAFRAEDAAQLERWQGHLVELGMEPSAVEDHRYFSAISLAAPDGLRVEIATDGPGFAVDEDAGTLGTALTLPEMLEPRRREIADRLTPLPN
jgi:glyoxalase family protein